MRGREGKGPPSADLLVCFPSRAHLTLMPKPICSPARPNSEPNNRHHHNHHRHHRRQLHHHLRKHSSIRGGGGHASPLMWGKNKATSSEIEEPTSPKVTCAGQIKVRPKPSTCKNWQSVMEEIEKLHNSKKNKKKSAWIEAFGFKKDVMQFLTCLRSIRFDFRCFGSFPTADIISDDDEDEDEDDEEEEQEQEEDNGNSRTVFSKWFMVLQENQTTEKEKERKEMIIKSSFDDHDVGCAPPPPPPSNALLLMRCRSAPAKSWLEELETEKKENGDDEEEKEDEDEEKLSEEEENAKTKENLVVMKCGGDFSKISSDIAKETWVVGGIKDSLSRSRSWKR